MPLMVAVVEGLPLQCAIGSKNWDAETTPET
jgi:hypothetical protein